LKEVDVNKVRIGERWVGEDEPVYVIAEIGANFDGSIEQAKYMVDLAKEVGADAAKFQSFLPENIVAKDGFQTKTSFQTRWGKSVWQVYTEAAFPRRWHKELANYCHNKGIDFLSSPYDKEAVDLLYDIGVPAFKIGSGDITFLSLVEYIASKNKPVLLGTGASSMGEIEEAVNTVRATGNENIVLLQCVTNYPTSFEDANIRAMITLKNAFQVPVGYSDHTPGSVVPLGAVALGACLVEKHFTHDKTLSGPDHSFAMDVPAMKSMVTDIRHLEMALGSPVKRIVPSEAETVIIQRRSLFAKIDINMGTVITEDNVEPLRPATGITPQYMKQVIGKEARVDISQGEPITWEKI